MTTKLDKLKALLAKADVAELKAMWIDIGDIRALIVAVEAAQEVYKEWDADCEPWPPDYQQLGEALKPFGENDEKN